MAAFLHNGLDRLMIALGTFSHHHALEWVEPPVVSPDVPLGEVLPEPARLGVVWPRQAGVIEIEAPTPFLAAPNHRLVLRFWPTTRPRRGTVILVPPWKLMSLSSLRPVVSGLNRRGYDVVGYPTPFHFERTPKGSFSGEYFATWDMPRTGWAIRAAAHELCALTESLRHRGPVVLLGLSLGGYLSSMASVVAPLYPHRGFAMDRLALVVPPESILDTFLKTPVGDRYRYLLRKAGGTVPDNALLYQLSLPFSPARFSSVVPGEKILVQAGSHDAIVPEESSRRLAQGLGARFIAHASGHFSALMFNQSVWRNVGKFLLESPVLDRPPREDEIPTKDQQTG